MKITTSGEWSDEQRGGSIMFRSSRRWWIRLAAYYGRPPGSHIGLWRTRVDPLYGLNLRIGKRYVGPCLTMFVHFRRAA